MRLRHPTAALLGVLSATGMVTLTGAGEVVGGGGVATACAQLPTVPTEAVPTIGPVDPACSRVPDTDNDSVFDYEDNCNGYFNPSQRDTDGDEGPKPYEPVDTKTNPRDPATGGDTCDVDDDGDLIEDVNDNCSKIANKDQADADRDGIGDPCDEETVIPAAPASERRNPGTTAPPPGGGPAPAPAAAPQRPVFTVSRIPRTMRVAELGSGIAVPVRCSAACLVEGRLVADRRSARKLRLTALGRGAARVEEAGMTFVFVRLSRTALSRVRRARKATATIRLTVADPQGGNRQSATRRVTLRR